MAGEICWAVPEFLQRSSSAIKTQPRWDNGADEDEGGLAAAAPRVMLTLKTGWRGVPRAHPLQPAISPHDIADR